MFQALSAINRTVIATCDAVTHASEGTGKLMEAYSISCGVVRDRTAVWAADAEIELYQKQKAINDQRATLGLPNFDEPTAA
jgi:hypothetical protein